jgi:hypothetical protein
MNMWLELSATERPVPKQAVKPKKNKKEEETIMNKSDTIRTNITAYAGARFTMHDVAAPGGSLSKLEKLGEIRKVGRVMAITKGKPVSLSTYEIVKLAEVKAENKLASGVDKVRTFLLETGMKRFTTHDLKHLAVDPNTVSRDMVKHGEIELCGTAPGVTLRSKDLNVYQVLKLKQAGGMRDKQDCLEPWKSVWPDVFQIPAFREIARHDHSKSWN